MAFGHALERELSSFEGILAKGCTRFVVCKDARLGLYDEGMNFQIFKDGPLGTGYVIDRRPLPGEKAIYKTVSMGTLASGEDYAAIASLPAKSVKGNVLLIEGVRMEGSEAAIFLAQ